MILTFDDLLEKLKQEEETDLLELLNLNSEELVELLEERIEQNQDRLRYYYGESNSALDW